MKSRIQKGMVAGFAATVVTGLLEAANELIGPWAVSLPRQLSFMLQADGNMVVGWIAHLVAGTLILGPAFGALCPRLPTYSQESKGILFAVGAWILMSLTISPMSGLGLFAAEGGFGTIAWMLVIHVVFGIVLGAVYRTLVQREKRAAHAPVGAATA